MGREHALGGAEAVGTKNGVLMLLSLLQRIINFKAIQAIFTGHSAEGKE